MHSNLNEFDKFFSKYENLNEKYSELKKQMELKENELIKMRILFLNGKETSKFNSDYRNQSEHLYIDEDNFVFNKKIRSKKSGLARY